MTLYSVYARPAQVPQVIADRFSWFAALLPPVYAIVHGTWLLLAGWVVGALLVAVIGLTLGTEAGFWTYVVFAIFIGFEATTFRRTRLGRRGWAYGGDIVAADEDLALLEAVRRT